MNYKSSFVLYCCLHLVYCPNKRIIKRLSVLYCCLHILVHCPNSSSFQISYTHCDTHRSMISLACVYIFTLRVGIDPQLYAFTFVLSDNRFVYQNLHFAQRKKKLHIVSKHNCFVWWIDNRKIAVVPNDNGPLFLINIALAHIS